MGGRASGTVAVVARGYLGRHLAAHDEATAAVPESYAVGLRMWHFWLRSEHSQSTPNKKTPATPVQSSSCPECIQYVLPVGLYPQFVVITVPSIALMLYGSCGKVPALSEIPSFVLTLAGPSQEADEEGHPVLSDGLRCFWNWYAVNSYSSSPPVANPRKGRTTFVNTLCGKQVLQSKDADDAENAHVEEGVRIRPVTVGSSACTYPSYCPALSDAAQPGQWRSDPA